MTEYTSTAQYKDCGCGTTALSGSCECGGNCSGECAQCGNECQGGPLQRPRFFSGQLLTEDDLQLLSDYVASKSRLHNRFLHGAGVVCGMEVVCHPCGGGKVIVRPGHAVDCCGNDIVLPCPVELDINQMIHDLRIRINGGYDCGDPCEEECEEINDRGECVDRKGRRYCLYINYCEELENPVTPYASDDNCAVQVCEPTRIREGYQFELRCVEDDPAPNNIWTRVKACIGDLKRADRVAEDALAAGTYGQQTMVAAPMIKAQKAPNFEIDDREQLIMGTEQLMELNTVIDSGEMDISETRVRTLIDTFQGAASAVVRYGLLSDGDKESLESVMPGVTADVEQARELVRAVAQPLNELAAIKLGSKRDKVIAETWIEQGLQWTEPDLSPQMRMSSPHLQYALNTPYSSQLQNQFSADLVNLRDWLLGQLDKRPLFGDCKLRHDILAIHIPQNSEPNSEAMAEAGRQLMEALLRYLVDCICAALNPPCQPCKDRAVKLACLEVDDCEVCKICNLERTFVLSGPAFRYWIPFLHTIGELFEKACCESKIRIKPKEKQEREHREFVLDDVSPPKQSYIRQPRYFASTAPAYHLIEDQPQLGTLFKIAKIDESMVRSVVNLGGNMSAITGLNQKIDAPPMDLDKPPVTKKLGEMAVAAIMKQPQVREALVGETSHEVELLKRRMELVEDTDKDSLDLVEVVDQRIESRMNSKIRNVNRALDRRLTASGLSSTKVVKDLKSALKEQAARYKKLETKLVKLEKERRS